MKIVGFEANNGARLGIVEGDNVVDLQAADANLPGDLGEVLRRSNGDLKPLAGLAKECSGIRASTAGRFEICIARCATWENNLSRIELSRPRQGRSATRQYPEVSLDLFPRVDLDGAASAADRQAARVEPARL